MSKAISRRNFLKASALSVGAAFLASCTPKATEAPAADAPAAAPPEAEIIQLRYSHWGNEDEKASTRAVLDEFEKANPNIKVEQIYIPEAGDAFLQKLNSMAASNSLPDGSLFPDGSAVDWGLKDMFLDLTDTFVGVHEKVDAIKFILPDGRLIGVSAAQETFQIWYAKEMFDAESIGYPPDAGEKAWSWNEFLEIAKELTVDTQGRRAGTSGFDADNVNQFGVQTGTWLMPVLAMVRSNGGDYFTDDFMTLTIDRPENIEAIQMISDLMNVHKVMPKPTSGGGLSSLSTDNALLSKKIAMKWDGQWVLETLNRVRRESDLKFGIGVLPFMKEPVTTATGGPIVGFKASQHPAEAKMLVNYIMDPITTPVLIQGGLWMPNEKRWYTEPEYLSQWIDNENHPPEYKSAVVDYSMKYVSNVLPYYRLPAWSGFEQLLNPALDQVWLGEKTAEQAIAEVKPQLQDYFDTEILSLMKG